MFYQFELSYSAAESTKNINCAIGDSTVDHSRVTKESKKFPSGCKNHDDQARYGRPKSVDSGAVLQTLEANLASCNRRVSGEFGISESCLVLHLHDLGKKHTELPNCASLTTKILQNF